MRFASVEVCLWVTFALSVREAPAKETIHLATAPALSPDGATLAFVWRGDIWLVSSSGGVARPWSAHPGGDDQPHFSPDGKRIAFTSQRTGTQQVYVGERVGRVRYASHVSFRRNVRSRSGFPTASRCWSKDAATRLFLHPQRLFRVDVTKRAGEELLFDATAADGAVSPDGRKILFTREGVDVVAEGLSRQRRRPDLALRYCRPARSPSWSTTVAAA